MIGEIRDVLNHMHWEVLLDPPKQTTTPNKKSAGGLVLAVLKTALGSEGIRTGKHLGTCKVKQNNSVLKKNIGLLPQSALSCKIV